MAERNRVRSSSFCGFSFITITAVSTVCSSVAVTMTKTISFRCTNLIGSELGLRLVAATQTTCSTVIGHGVTELLLRSVSLVRSKME